MYNLFGLLLCIGLSFINVKGLKLSKSNQFFKKKIELAKVKINNDNDPIVNFNINHKSLPPAFTKLSSIPTLALIITSIPSPTYAMELTSNLNSAFTAYGHYLGLILVCISLVIERLLIKPNMSIEDEKTVIKADIVYGLAGLLILITGYFRVTAFGKGWDFYSHEPLFWVKLCLFSIMGSSSLFPTIKLIQRSLLILDFEKGKVPSIEPISSKLANRLIKIINGEILAIMSIPLAASLMARGVGYLDWFPWEAGVIPLVLIISGLGIKYVTEAIQFKED